MKFADVTEKAVDYCGQAMALMARHKIPPHPVHYEVWFTHVSGANQDLSRAIEDHLKANSGAITAEVSETLWQQYCGRAATYRALDETASEMADEVARTLAYLERSAHETNAYGNAMEHLRQRLAANDLAEDLPLVVDRILEATRRMEEKTRALELELDQTTTRIKTLYQSLELTKREAKTDTLTGLLNRACFDGCLQEAVREAEERGHPLSIVVGDIDKFEQFNETWGHLTGDQVLRLVGQCLRENIKGRDMAARFGGEEFAVIFPETPVKGAKIVAEHVRETVARKKIVKKSSGEMLGRISMSFGAAELRHKESVSDFLTRACMALRAAKARGANCVVGEDDLETPDADEDRRSSVA